MDRRILVVDDSELVCQQLSQLLALPGRRIKVAHDGTTALEWLVERNFSLVLTDLCLPGIAGLDLIREIRQRDLPVTVDRDDRPCLDRLGRRGDEAGRVRLPAQADRLGPARSAGRAGPGGPHSSRTRSGRSGKGLQQRYAFHNLVGSSPRMREVFARVARVASSLCTVLITGETGTGKELVAQAIHYTDATRQGPLVAVELRGAARAAPGKRVLRPRARRVHRGRPPEEGAVRAGQGRHALPRRDRRATARACRPSCSGSCRTGPSSGSAAPRSSRPIAGSWPPPTSTWPRPSPRAGSARTCITGSTWSPIELPPLRERLDDIPAAGQPLPRSGSRNGDCRPRRSRARPSRGWPGTSGRGTSASSSTSSSRWSSRPQAPSIEPENLPAQIVSTREEPFSLDFDLHRPLQSITDELTERIERAYLARVLERYRGRIDRCAAHCGLSRRSISEKLRRYRIDKAEFKPDTAARRSARRARCHWANRRETSNAPPEILRKRGDSPTLLEDFG